MRPEARPPASVSRPAVVRDGASPAVAGVLARDQFAYLRACISGVPRSEAAQRYLGLEPGPAARSLHRQLIDQLQALARQRGDARWSLLAMTPRRRVAAPAPAPQPPAASSFEDWVAAHGWEDWSQAEQLEAYAAHLLEQAPAAASPAAPPRIDFLSRAEQRLHRLQQRQLALLQDLERAPVPGGPGSQARPHDPVGRWFDPATAARLQAAGWATLAQLQRAVRHSAQWHRGVKAVGEGKARRIEALLSRCLPAEAAPVAMGLDADWQRQLQAPSLDGSRGRFRAAQPRIAARTDAAALEAWLDAATAHAPATRAAYRREAERWWLWCVVERGRPLSSCDGADARAYLEFLADVPERWQSRRTVERWAPGWTPFRGPLGPQSRRFAFKVLHRFCEWLADDAGYLDHNPWAGVERWRAEAGERPLPPEARVLPGEALAALQAALPDPAQPGTTRNGLLLSLCNQTGLRASELLAATVGRLHRVGEGWEIEVGAPALAAAGRLGDPLGRRVALPAAAVGALEQALAGRGFGSLATCPADVPLLAAAQAAGRRPSYGALHRSFKGFVARVLKQPPATLAPAVCASLSRTTQQWLRHTFARRAADAGMPVDLLRHHLGHADSRRVRRYYRPAPPPLALTIP